MSDFQNSSNIKPSTVDSENVPYEDESLWKQEDLPGSDPEIIVEADAGLTADAQEETREQESRFKDGQILSFVKVRFSGNAKAFPFFIGKRQFQYGQTVVAMSDRGMMVGYINSFPYEKSFDKSLLPIRSIARVATQEDIKQQEDFVFKEKESERVCVELIEKYKLDMVLTHVEYTQFGKKAVFFFTAPARVDFRDLVKELVGRLRMRIELRQISLRDRAAAIGGIAVCGLQTCCSSFLSAYGNVSIKMAKNQNLALVPSKLNGLCGQIKCCIRYEEEVYSEKRSRLPKENSYIQTKNGDFGKVLQLSILEEQFEMLTDRGIICNYSGDMYDSKLPAPAGKKFPESFEFVTRNTGPIITMATCGNLLPQYRPQPVLKTPTPIPVIDKDEDEDNDSDSEYDAENEDGESDESEENISQEDKDKSEDDVDKENIEDDEQEQQHQDQEDESDEEDAASDKDIAKEVRPKAVTAIAPLAHPIAPKSRSPNVAKEQDPERRKQKDRALQRFKKRTKRR